jgi:membrane protein involved in colicin uptake
MTTPAQYHHQLEQLDLDAIPVDGLSPEAARSSLDALTDLQARAQEIERAVILDIQVIRTQYQRLERAASAGVSNQSNLNSKRRMSSRVREEEIAKVDAERDSRLAPYEEVRQEIEKLLGSAGSARKKLEDQLNQEKEAKKPGDPGTKPTIK